MTDAAGRARAWGWVAHLRAGGTTPWAQWTAAGEPAGGGARPHVLPGAAQLELLRRLNLADPGRTPDARLVDRVLTVTPPGRAVAERELVGAAWDDRFGMPPVDPAELPDEEVLRSATHLLAQDLVAAGPVPRPVPRQRPWRRRVAVAGDPWLRSELQRSLTASGHAPRPGGRVVVVGAPLPVMLADAWTHACYERPVAGWEEWLEQWRDSGGLPPGVGLAAIAQRWAERVGPRRVQVVLDESLVPRALGRRGLAPVRRPGRTTSALARRIAVSLDLLAPVAEHRALLRDGLLPRLPDDCFDSDLPVVPPEHQGWVAERGDRMAGRLRRSGYAVAPRQWSIVGHDTPEGTAPLAGGGSGEALELALRLLREGRLTDGRAAQ